jgi:arylsulfatase B/arylsulfatase I/J
MTKRCDLIPGNNRNTIFILSADNGGIQKGGGESASVLHKYIVISTGCQCRCCIYPGYNWPMRGEKATLWEGGSRATGFIHSALLKMIGFEYHGLVHVSDWLPSLYHLAGGAGLDGIDGIDVWEAIVTNGTSPRKELLHNIDMLNGGDAGLPFGSASLRVGDMKLILGRPGVDQHFIPPGCSPSVCIPPVMPTRPECLADTNGTHVWLFNISNDPLELCNLAASQPDAVATMITRLKYYNDTAVPALCPPNDPASNPVGANRSSDPREWGSWGPWRQDV